MSASIVTILNELEKTLGRDTVLEACKNFVTPPSGKKSKKEKEAKEKKEPNKWILQVREVFEELASKEGVKMREVDQSDEAAVAEARKEFNKAAKEKGVDQKKAMQVASERNRANDPAAQAKYEKNKEKKKSE